MSRTAFAARTLASEIQTAFDGQVSVAHVGTPDGWGTVRALRVDGATAERVRINDLLNVIGDRRIEQTALVGDSLFVDLVPRADDPAEFGIRRRVAAST